jgi:CHAT domain-containing protein
LDAYSRAVAALDNAPLRIGQRDSRDLFSQRIRPVYASLADVVLHQAQQQELTHDLLRRSIATLERMKAAELAHYFKDPCVAKTKRPPAMPSTPPALNIPPRTALLYPFLLPDRIELLLLKTSKIHHLKVDASYTQVAETIKTFQKNLKIRNRWIFAEQSKQLYAWFIAPAKPMLKDIDTLVIVPDSVLRMVPPAAFYNAAANTFLVEEFALAITPALDLTDIQSVSTKDAIFLGGLSKGVQGFSPLPGVYEEIETIESFFVDKNIVLDQNFIRQTLHDVLQNNSYSIVHLASHGQFSSDPEDSFILTYDDKLHLKQLSEVFASQNIDLLTLSACQTAVGDEQAALGFAGVAIKAGVRSALASLWYVSDEATSLLMSEFYQQLRQPGISKAQAFRLAQTKLLHSRAFRHPYSWAPFMLIGNWL